MKTTGLKVPVPVFLPAVWQKVYEWDILIKNTQIMRGEHTKVYLNIPEKRATTFLLITSALVRAL